MASISGLHHTGIVVSDMERSKKWYQEMIGLTLEDEFDLDSSEIQKGVGVQNCRLVGAMLKWGKEENGQMIELLHYPSHPGKRTDRNLPSYEYGVRHVAFSTTNAIDELYEKLSSKGVEFLSAPQEIEIEGNKIKFCYFKDPDGNQLEFIGS